MTYKCWLPKVVFAPTFANHKSRVVWNTNFNCFNSFVKYSSLIGIVMGMSINSSRDQLDREDSFSFTCYDLINSAPALFSEDHDDFASVCDDESYIEIALGNEDDGESEEFELRISLSTTADHTKILDNPGFETDTIPETTPSSLSSSSSSSTFAFSCSSTGACSLAGVPSEMGEESFHPNQNREKLIDINPWELVRSRYICINTLHMQY